ncbi:MAG: alpha/beta fold hydrolase [Solirubrobacterales bacterium]
MSRWLKITLAVLAGLIVLLLLNAVVVSNATKDAYVRDHGARLVDTANGTLQVLDEEPLLGSPIVLIHGYTGSMNWWDRLAPLLTRSHRVIRVDLLGHGGSAKPGGGYSIEDQASAIAEALAKLHVVNATVVGHSLGGAVATALAEQSPRLASRVVILDEAVDNSDVHRSLGERMGHWPIIGQAESRLVQVVPASVVRGQYDQAFAPGFNISTGFDNSDQVVDDLRAMTYTAYKEMSDAEDDFGYEQPLDQRLAVTHLPVMVVFGAEDQINDAQESVAAYGDVPGVQTHIIPGAGHSPQVEKPALLAPLILSFASPAARQAKSPATAKLAPE